jgi:hypothetical protein
MRKVFMDLLDQRSTLKILMAAAFAGYLPLASAAAGDVPFRFTSEAASVLLGCNGAAPAPYNDVDPVFANTNGGSDLVASQVFGSACPGLLAPRGVQIYSYQYVDDSAYAYDTPSSDYGEAKSLTKEVSLLGGVLTYDQKQDEAVCTETSYVSCTQRTTISNLTFEGRSITGTFSQKQVIPASGLQLQLATGTCTGLAEFTGYLTIDDAVTSATQKEVDFIPLALDGTLTCLGVPAGTIEIHIKDYSKWEYDDQRIVQNMEMSKLVYIY